ncbi:hypothetical protein [Flavobacterium poyangense]|uniref:hypothetical protein n=1 Tax=Flavobacterium poyangense TaxID=2204302 RepID=UPI001422370D|nr:hypothetical protein [Flavobacterium sp. JXAS1]
MTQDQEKELLKAIYDRMFDAITYQPSTGTNPFKETETFIHFSKNAAVDVKSFANPRTPSNPLGDLKSSEEFSRMVDQISPMSLEWSNSSNPLSKNYEDIVLSANASTTPDPKQTEMYDKAYNYLHPLKNEKNPFTGEEVTARTDGDDYVLYESNLNDYVASVIAYRSAYNLYLDDLESKDSSVQASADRNWQTKAPLLENNIKASYRKLTAGNAKYVEQALAILNTTINDGIRQTIVRAREAVGEDNKFSSSLGFSDKWLFSYSSPANWTEEGNLNFTELKISGGNTKTRSQATEHSFSVSTDVNYGLWKVKASAEGSFSHSTSSADKDTVEISAKIAKVNILRPWFSESLFRLGSWSTNMLKSGEISNGKIDSTNASNYIPMYPVAFIVAKDISIKAAFSHEEEEHIKESMKTSASVGWGPISVSGSYGYGHSEDKFDSNFQNGEITVPGMQIIGWVSKVIPFSPKENSSQ